MKKNKILIIIGIIILAIIGMLFGAHYFSRVQTSRLIEKKNTEVQKPQHGNVLSLNNKNYKIEIADTPQEREKGLSNRELLPEDSGLLFVFEQAAQYGFWMKDMNFSIDIIWLDEDFKIVHIKENADPKLYPEVYKNEIPALYVLETNIHFVQDHDLKVRDTLSFTLEN